VTQHSYQQEFQKALDHFQRELAGLRTGRASPSLLEGLRAEYYGTQTPLNQLATITAPEPMLLQLQVWDASAIQEVEKAIRSSHLGLNPVVDSQLIRVPLPKLTEERRQELVKLAKQKAEAARISVRTIREEAMKVIKEQALEGTLSEDSAEQARKVLQKSVDRANTDIQSLLEKKEAEILTI
jgi:ribosome recycling factor